MLLWSQAFLLAIRRQRIQELLEKQGRLKAELAEAKAMLMVDPSSWSYDRKNKILHTYVAVSCRVHLAKFNICEALAD